MAMTDSGSTEQRDGPTLIDLLAIVVSRRRAFAIITLSSIILGLILAFSVTRYYKSVGRVLPPSEKNTLAGIAGLSSLGRALPQELTGLIGEEDTHNFIAILRSRGVMESIVRQFDLIQVYRVPDSSMERAVETLEGNTEIEWTEERTLEIRVWDEDARRASEITNSYVSLLNKRFYELQTQEARNAREFIERRLGQNREELYEAETMLQQYQEKTGMVFPPDILEGQGSVAELFGTKVRKEIELEILRRSVGEENSQYQQLQLELETLKRKIAKFPEVGIESLRLVRQVIIQQRIMEIIVPLYEQARVDEHKDVPVAYVLDTAIPGERPDKPRRIFIVGIATFLGIAASLGFIWMMEYGTFLKAHNPHQWEKLKGMMRAFRVR